MSETKVCSKCGAEKPVSEFYRKTSSKDGRHPHCKPCDKANSRRRNMTPERIAALVVREQLVAQGLKECPCCARVLKLDCFSDRPDRANGLAKRSHCKDCTRRRRRASYDAVAKEERRDKAKARYAAKAEANRARARSAYWADREKTKARNRVWRELNKDHTRQLAREWYHANREKANSAKRAHYRANKDAYIASNRRRKKERIKEDPVFAMSERIRALIYVRLRAGGYTKKSRSQEILGCDWPTFAAHIERQFLPGMSWDNRSAWHLDHIVPLATAETEEDVIRLNHFTNLRPLWAADNIRKSDTITHLI